MTKFGLIALFVATAAYAQGKPTLVDFPLDVKSAVSDTQLVELEDDFRQMLARNTGILVPTRTNWKLAVAAHKRQDCEVRNECLQQLAISAATLYAMYCSVEKNASGEVTATGRVVNQDGALVRPPEQVKVARRGTFNEGAHEALTLLLARLELEKLSPVLTKPDEVKKPGTPEPIILVTAPPPEPESSPLRPAGLVVAGLAVVSAAVAIGFGVSAASARGGLPADGHLRDESQAQVQRSVNQGATISLASGAAAVALGVTSFVMLVLSSRSSSATASLTLAPGPGSATLLLTGEF